MVDGYTILRGDSWIARDLTAEQTMAFLTMGLGVKPGPMDLEVVRQSDSQAFTVQDFMTQQRRPIAGKVADVALVWGNEPRAEDRARVWESWPELAEVLERLRQEVDGA